MPPIFRRTQLTGLVELIPQYADEDRLPKCVSMDLAHVRRVEQLSKEAVVHAAMKGAELTILALLQTIRNPFLLSVISVVLEHQVERMRENVGGRLRFLDTRLGLLLDFVPAAASVGEGNYALAKMVASPTSLVWIRKNSTENQISLRGGGETDRSSISSTE